MGTSKKIAVLCNYQLTSGRVGGMDRFFWLFDKECKAKGYQVVWFFPNKESHGEYATLSIAAPENDTSLELFFLKYIKENQTQFDVVITHFLELCTSFFKEVKRVYPSKTIAVDHNPRPLEGFPLKKRISKKIKGILFGKYTDLFIGVSDYTVKHILNDYGTFLKQKTKRIYNGIYCEVFLRNLNRKIEKPKFVVTSNLRFIKGIQDLIDAVALLPEGIKNEISIDLYGEGNYETYLKNKIHVLGLDNNFNFKGSSPNLNITYAKYDYMIQPTYMECFSLSILESLAANVPVITTTVGGNQEVIRNGINGYIFEPKDISKLSKIIENLFLGNDGIHQTTNELIENNFSIQKMVNEHIKILE